MKPVLFLHFHKSGGTTVNTIFEGVLQKFPNHANGNPHNDKGVILFWKFSPGRFSRFYQKLSNNGTKFIAMEWNFFQRPIPWKKFHFLTVIRDPYERFISNMNVDGETKPIKYLRKNIIIKRKTRKITVCFNTPNYYVRMLNGLGDKPHLRMTRVHLERAKKVLSKFHTVVVLEMKDSFSQLTALGVPHEMLNTRSNASSTKRYFFSKAKFEILNRLDRKLYLFARTLVDQRNQHLTR